MSQSSSLHLRPSAVPALLALALATLAAAQPRVAPGEAMNLTTPAVSPDGATLCFGYLGDLWLVPRQGGQARRLTDHVAPDTDPVWSPDGRWIAFSSSRDGNDDVFLAPSDGGPATQLTFHSVRDGVTGFTPDSREVIFASARAGLDDDLWAVSTDGGMPRRLTADRVQEGTLSPDGTTLAVTRGTRRWWRKGYRGSADGEIWLAPVDGSPMRPVTDDDVNDFWPLWSADGRSLFHVSERSGSYNLWRQPLDGGAAVQLTRHEGDGVESPALSADGRTLVYVRAGLLHVLSTSPGSSPVRVPVVARSGDKISRRERLTVARGATDLALSPDGDQVAFVVHGEVFTLLTGEGDDGDEKEDARRRTDSPGRDQQPSFVRGEDALVFLSDRDGQQDVWRVDLRRKGRFAPERLTDTPHEEGGLRVSPDGELLLFTLADGSLHVAPTSGGPSVRLADGPEIYTPAWSPDSGWIAYERHDASGMGDIFAVAATGGDPINLTRSPAHQQRPFWSPDGTTLGYESDEDGDWDLWTLKLLDDDERERREKARQGEGSKKKKKRKSRKSDDDVEPIEIDPDEDHEPHHLLDMPGAQGEAAFSPDSKRVAFLSDGEDHWDLWVADADGDDPERLTNDPVRESSPTWLPDAEHVLFLSGGEIRRVRRNGKNRGGLPFSIRMTVDHSLERRQVFLEAWRQLRHRFYDAAMHDRDWDAVRDRYLPLLDHVATREELHLVITRMLGELNASHLGIGGGDDDEDAADTGHLGLTFAADAHGLRVTDVLPEGPCDEDGARVEVGEHLVAIGGLPLENGANVHDLLDGKVGKRVTLTLARRPGGKTRDVVVEPLGRREFGEAIYERWEDERKAIVKERSGDRVGYVHLRSMNQDNLRKFRRAIIGEVHDKAALVIDVRFNGGGNIHAQLLEILEGRPYIVSHPRDGHARVNPAMGWHRPMLVLINERSGSDAEIFPHGFRTLGLGKLVGVPTAGAVIGTGGTTLMDGSQLRLPGLGWYSLDGRNLENWGIEPDVLVEQDPADRANGVDTQLERAVAIMLDEIGEAPGEPVRRGPVGSRSERR